MTAFIFSTLGYEARGHYGLCCGAFFGCQLYFLCSYRALRKWFGLNGLFTNHYEHFLLCTRLYRLLYYTSSGWVSINALDLKAVLYTVLHGDTWQENTIKYKTIPSNPTSTNYLALLSGYLGHIWSLVGTKCQLSQVNNRSKHFSGTQLTPNRCPFPKFLPQFLKDGQGSSHDDEYQHDRVITRIKISCCCYWFCLDVPKEEGAWRVNLWKPELFAITQEA